MKLEKMKAPVAGQYLPVEHASQVFGAITESGMPEEFVEGVLFATSFFTCPANADMHGMTPEGFLSNFLQERAGEPPAEVVSKAQEIIEQLESMGVNVVGAFLMKGGN